MKYVNWFRKFFSKEGDQITQTVSRWPLPTEFKDQDLFNYLIKIFEEMHVNGRALFLVGLENWTIYYNIFCKALRKSHVLNRDLQYSESFDGYVSFLFDKLQERQQGTIDYEFVSRRCYYFYLATLINEASARASKNPNLWDNMVDVWVPLIDGARSIRTVLDQTKLWCTTEAGTDETDWFKDVNTPEDGEKYIKSILMPQIIRYHPKFDQEVINYIKKTKGQEEARELEKIFAQINEELIR